MDTTTRACATVLGTRMAIGIATVAAFLIATRVNVALGAMRCGEPNARGTSVAAPPAAAPRTAASVQATLSVASTPDGAEVWVNSRVVGRTPIERMAVTSDSSGRVTVVVAADRHHLAAECFALAAGEHLRFHAALLPITAATPELAAITSGGAAPTPVSPAPTPQPEARVATGATGTLTLSAKPWAAVIFMGREIGITPLTNLEFPVGTHVLILVNKERQLARPITVEIVAGQVTFKKVNLDGDDS